MLRVLAPLTVATAVLLWLGGCRGSEQVAEGPCCSALNGDPAVSVTGACDESGAGQAACQAAEAVTSPAAAAPAAGMRAYVDPETGELLEKPPPGATPPPSPPAAGGDATGQMRAKPAPGGGVMIEEEDAGGLRQY